MAFSAVLEELLQRKNLTAEAITSLITETMLGEMSPTQMSAWLIALRMKGETPAEIAACARVMRQMATKIDHKELPPLVMDTCGTGGDRSHLINISTLVALTLAAHSIPVAKHGNRAVSSSSGSADVLEALGYPLAESAESTTRRLKETNFAFFYAPLYHPALKHAGPVRRELGVRTVFNILGPLANPANAQVQLLGVYDKSLLVPMAETLRLLSVEGALIVNSEDGLDEISPVAATHFALLQGVTITTGVFEPPQQSYIRSLDVLKAESKEESVKKFRSVLEGKDPAGAYMVALNAAFALRIFKATQAKQTLTSVNPTSEEIETIFQWISAGNLESFISDFSRRFDG